MNIGLKLKQTRKKLKKTQLEISKEIGINRAYLSQIENGKATSLNTFLKWCKALDINPAEILDENRV